MAEIKIIISDYDLDIEALIAQFSKNGNVTINIQTEIGADTLTPEAPTVEVTELDLSVLNSLEGEELTDKISELHELGASWKELGTQLGIRGDSVYRRVYDLKKRRKGSKKASKKAAKKAAKKTVPKAKPKPKKPSVPDLTEQEIIEAVYGSVAASSKGVHFAKRISETIVTSYRERYADDAKLEEFIKNIHKRIESAINKIALALGPTKCMVTRSREATGEVTLQLMVYNNDIPTLDVLWNTLKKNGIVD